MRRTVIVGLALGAAVTPALTVDGGIGRTITATWVLPSTAVVGLRVAVNIFVPLSLKI